MKMFKPLLTVVGLFLTGCVVDQREKAQDALADPVLREEIFHVIQNDSTMLRGMMTNMVSYTNDPQNYTMRYRMVRLVFNSPVMDSLLMNDNKTRSQIFEKMLRESDHNDAFRQEMSNGILQNKKLVSLIREE